ncbi:gliding motility-associated C-terminal domain-containing protein [Aureivirga sp. CE67]|uniref:gliding motility-associated C-terminal domain-containing protein n=1 Tax=Aureivirga sp. CE67 TaxID=1788983 RepID=UPI0018CB9A7B|nr:gliding motility-associated C-terminal domain-containing protein [Aureivirga sp. CE67]
MIKNYTAFFLLSLSLIGFKGYSQSIQSPLDGIDIEGNLIVGCNAPSTTLTLDFFDVGTTENYEVTSIPFAPPYPFTGGTELEDLVDDIWTEGIALGFTFDYFGQIFDEAAVGTNGQVTFDSSLFDAYNNWSFTQELPSTALPTNTIFGAYHDIDITIDNLGQNSFNYYVVGEAPFRALVANYYKIKHFSGACSDYETTQQIVLYEATNIIDVYLKSKPMCDQWNQGNAVVGIQNGDGTQAIVAPDRNTSQWEAYNEGWRFTPSGVISIDEEVETITWTDSDGNVIESGAEIVLSPTETTTYTVTITYLQSDGTLKTATKEFTVEFSDLELAAMNDIQLCDTNDDGIQQFDLSGIEQSIIDQHPTDELVFTYYDGNGDEITDLSVLYENVIANEEVITVKAVSNITECESETTVTLIVDQLELNTVDTLYACDNGNGFGDFDTTGVEASLVDGLSGNFQFSYTDESGNTYETLPQTLTNTIADEETITATVSTDDGCISTRTFKLEIYQVQFDINVPNDIVECDDNTDGITEFDTTGIHETIVGGQDVDVLYFDEAGNELSSPLPNPYTNTNPNLETISFVLVNKENGCRTEPLSFNAIVNPIEDENCEFIIPEGFSPNGNGVNDTFEIVNIRTRYPNFKIEFFNRWGNVVYTQDASKADWNGQLNGDDTRAPAGVYFIVVNFNDGETEPYQGRLYLNR